MKGVFSQNWISSKQPRKQRKYRFNAPLHIKSKFMNALLSKKLRETYGFRSLRVRKGDTVKIMRGQFKGKTVKVQKVDLHSLKLILDGISVTKRDGSKSFYPVSPSNVQIIEVEDDQMRFKKSSKKSSNESKTVQKEGKQEKQKSAIDTKKEVKREEKESVKDNKKINDSKSQGEK